MKILKLLFPYTLLVLTACNLTNEVDIELPEYESQPVVECYLEPGKPFRLLLTRSTSFFDPFALDSSFFTNTLLEGASVVVRYGGQSEMLQNQISFETDPLKIFNYTGSKLVPYEPGLEFELDIVLPNGKQINGRTTMLNRVPIDSIVVEWSPTRDTLARVLTYITDDLNQENFYRRLLNYGSLDSIPDQDFIVNDRINQTALIAFGTAYELTRGDTVFNTIFHISPDHYNYIESVQLAVFANINPFAQPSPIKGNLGGDADAIGIFTTLIYDRDTTVIE